MKRPSHVFTLVAFLLLTTTAPLMVAEAADFSYPGLDGRIHKLSDYQGKWVLVNYWATWCPPCLEELPELEVFHDNHKDKDAVVLGLNMEDTRPDRLRSFVEEQFLSYPILMVGSHPKEVLGEVPALPTSYLVNPEGKVVARQVGPVDGKSIEAFIKNFNKK
ncbi:TlpA family protein disulfide reductase [Thiolapillus brandeum]|uniref:Thioredoxin n=1 Tax=Thiolapillus brandeum TaxID=1076588 RepID=A0A7U6GKJ6_9GAMM|nr:TlpA disulfide reductase family protein [Thiolapillus brandeum]BAO45297.1 thioredoxin [Thiolapillus brandeum]